MLKEAYAYVRWFVRQIAEQFIAQGGLNTAAALTYTTLFAVVPLMTVTFSVLSIMPEFEGAGTALQTFIFENFLPQSSALIQETLASFTSQARGLTAAGVVILVVTAFMMLVNIEKAFNVIWKVAEPRRGLQRFFMYWGVLTFGPPLLAGGVVASSYLLTLPLVAGLEAYGLQELLFSLLPIVASIATFTVLYWAVPNCRVPFRHALFGGVVTMALFELAKLLFKLVVARSGTQLIYGAFAAVPFFLMWLYLVWVLVISGAILVRTLSLRRVEEASDGAPLVLKAAQVLKILYEAHLSGAAVTDEDIRTAVPMSRAQYERIFDVLGKQKLLTPTGEDGWVLGRSLKTVTLWDLYLKLPEALNVESLADVQSGESVVDRLKAFAKFGNDELSVTFDELFTSHA